MITIHTDGASRGNPGPGGWGAIIAYGKKYEVGSMEQDWITELGGREEHTTNNRMELTATIKALEFLTPYSILPTTVFTDSEYVMKGITEWINKWQKKNWKTANKKPVLNQDLWQRLLELTNGKNIEWTYVAGHAGVHLNERADEIATEFADNLKPALYHGPRDKHQ